MIDLSPETIRLIATEVVRQMRLSESASLDLQFMVSLPPGEMKKMLKARFDQQTRKNKEVTHEN